MVSTTFNCYFWRLLAGTTLALLLATLTKIGFPGWPDPNLDSVSGFGASIQKGGLHQPPFFISGAFRDSLSFQPYPATSLTKFAEGGSFKRSESRFNNLNQFM
jgi:hypothetical protein